MRVIFFLLFGHFNTAHISQNELEICYISKFSVLIIFVQVLLFVGLADLFL